MTICAAHDLGTAEKRARMPSAVAQESMVLAEQPLDNVKAASGELERDESLTASEVSAKVSLNDPVIIFVLAASLAF